MQVIKNMPNKEYQAYPAMSNSRLALFAPDENALEWAENCPVDGDALKTLDFGDAMHAICLEPERLDNDFAVLPELNLRTNAGKEEKKEFLNENQGKKILTYDEHKKLKLMYGSVMAHPGARMLLESEGPTELSCFWEDSITGLPCKCRPDKNILNSNKLVDIKTTPDLRKFKYSVEDYRYFVQAPFYTDGASECGLAKDEMEFIVIQKTIELGRYPVMTVTLPPEVVQYGREEYRKNLEDYARFLAKGRISPSVPLEMHPGFFSRQDEKTLQEIT